MRQSGIISAALLLGASARGGGGPFGTAVVVNDASPPSLEVGRYYAARRGIPDDHIVHLQTTNGFNIDVAAFSNEIRNPLIAWLGASGLSNQIDTFVFAPGFPYRVYQPPYGDLRHAGLTAALFQDFFSSPSAFTAGCQIAAGSSNAYFGAERAFTHAGAPSSNRYWMAALLAASNRLEALRLVDRAAASDHTAPTATVYLLHTGDSFRNGQWTQFEDVDFDLRLLGGPCTSQIEEAYGIAGRTNVMGCMAGDEFIYNIGLNYILPGAFAHHLTSYGGFLFDVPGQMSALDWIHHGYAGTYGTVVEPCALAAKFPQARLHCWYARGFSLGESAWMSLRNPYQGVLVGDPLAAPYAATGRVEVAGLTNGQTLAGTVAVTAHVAAARATAPLDRVDLYLDGRRLATLTNAGPAAGNVIALSVGTATAQFVFAAGGTVFDAATALAAGLATAGAPVVATAWGDRVAVVHTNRLAAGTNVVFATSAGAGTAAAQRVWGFASGPALRASPYPAREFIGLRGAAGAGDEVACRITLTNGVVVTSRVVAAGGEASSVLLPLLMGVVNSNAALQGADGAQARYFDYYSATNVQAALEARAPGAAGAGLSVDYQITRAVATAGLAVADSFSDAFNDNADALGARAQVLLAGGGTALVAVASLDTTAWPDGPHELTWAAREGTAVASETLLRVPVRFANHSLTCRVVAPPPAHVAWVGEVVTARVEAAGATQVVLFVEGKPRATNAASPLVAAVATSTYGAGPLALFGEARGPGGAAVRSDAVVVAVAGDDDADGLPDAWEYQHFGSYDPQANDDPDGDGVVNLEEFLADTAPGDGASRLRVEGVTVSGLVAIAFGTSTARDYRVESHAGDLRAADGWLPLGTGDWPGVGGVLSVSDPADSNRAYRVRARYR